MNPRNWKAPTEKPKPEDQKKHAEKMDIEKQKKSDKPLQQSKHETKKA